MGLLAGRQMTFLVRKRSPTGSDGLFQHLASYGAALYWRRRLHTTNSPEIYWRPNGFPRSGTNSPDRDTPLPGCPARHPAGLHQPDGPGILPTGRAGQDCAAYSLSRPADARPALRALRHRTPERALRADDRRLRLLCAVRHDLRLPLGVWIEHRRRADLYLLRTGLC